MDPTPGSTDGTIGYIKSPPEYLTDTVIGIIWQSADDNCSASLDMHYDFYLETVNDLATVEDCEGYTPGMPDLDPYYDGFTVSDLLPNTTYYFNIVVTDEQGNKSAYIMGNVTTLSAH